MSYCIKENGVCGTVVSYEILCGEKKAQGVAIGVPDSQSSILSICCQHGMLFCRLFDVAVANKIGLPAAIMAAPFMEDMLKNTPVALSDAAIAMGATTEMTGAEIVELFS